MSDSRIFEGDFVGFGSFAPVHARQYSGTFSKYCAILRITCVLADKNGIHHQSSITPLLKIKSHAIILINPTYTNER